MVQIPDDIAADPVQAGIWAEICPEGNSFMSQDVPNLRLLCFWHAVAREAQRQIAHGGKLSLFDPVAFKPFRDANGSAVPLVRKSPALTVLKEATSEIRALSEALGITRDARARAGEAPQARTAKGGMIARILADRTEKEVHAR